MESHKAYKIAKRLIEVGDIHDLRSLLNVLPSTILARDMGIQHTRLKILINNPEGFRIRELTLFSRLIGVDRKVLLLLADAQISDDEKRRKKTR